MREENSVRVRVKSGDKEIEVQIPMTPRTALGMDDDGTGRRAIMMVEELVEEIKKL